MIFYWQTLGKSLAKKIVINTVICLENVLNSPWNDYVSQFSTGFVNHN